MSFIGNEIGNQICDAAGVEYRTSRNAWMTNIFNVIVAIGLGIGYLILTWYGGQIFEAAKKGDASKIKSILIATPDAIGKTDDKGRTPLHISALRGRSAAVKVFIEKGARLNARDKEGKTPLFLAVDSGDAESVKLLITAGADRSIADNSGVTPQKLAEQSGKSDIIKILKSTILK
ncbi:MAG TPA: ankyrin repeat domain-containing protein [Candidatus Wallbacteria bacterium]|nr:ankyrin repeat domain-containing protein [Candidatus Wallbacteria bacterium]